MSEKALKIVPPPEPDAEAKQEAKTRPGEQHGAEAPVRRRRRKVDRKRLRMVLLIVLPAIALVLGGAYWLMGGRYISTDNAYVGAQKVLITPDISGKIAHIAVVEGQHVKAGDELFTLDPQPYRLALDGAKAKLDAARSDYDKLKTNLKSLTTLADLAKKNVELKQHDVDRKTALMNSQAGSRADVDTATSALVTAKLQEQFTEQQRDSTLNQLLGNPDLPLAEFPEYAQAKAALDDAQRNLDHTVVRAPMSGTATQVDSIQLGRFVAAGTPVFSIIDDENPWVDANPKETDITYLRVGQKATLDVDSFPDHTFTGHVVSVSPGTGAQFSILPPQNATGNWVKVVQRVPVRIAFDKDEDTRLLRAGMSVNVEIDTGHGRIPFFSATAKEQK
ncbi:MAG TPA: HlyD family secretion protein [Pseudolabrys sp.]|nr:HlyD family secretion protein [Pseudolabrys sp.]